MGKAAYSMNLYADAYFGSRNFTNVLHAIAITFRDDHAEVARTATIKYNY